MNNTAIVSAVFPPCHDSYPSVDQPTPPNRPDDLSSPRLFQIRAVDSLGQYRTSASMLVNRMYAKRGYAGGYEAADDAANIITLLATEDDATIGTVSVRFDSPDGLNADDLFAEELGQLRARGRRVCEFTKLAVDSVRSSKPVLASLFHVAYIWSHRIKGSDDLIMEVNPRHVSFYRRMLGFRVMGGERHNRRVNAPAVLMHQGFAEGRKRIERFGGQPELAATERSLYPYFFAPESESGIVSRALSFGQGPERRAA